MKASCFHLIVNSILCPLCDAGKRNKQWQEMNPFKDVKLREGMVVDCTLYELDLR